MDTYKFSLPEGSDLKLRTYGAEAHLIVTYEGCDIFTGAILILGEKLAIRKGVLGNTLVVNTPDPLNTYNWANSIRRGIREHNEQKERRAERERRDAELRESLKHLEGMQINPTTRNMIAEHAQRSYDDTVRRMREAEIRQNTWYNGAIHSSPGVGIRDFVVREDSLISPNQMIAIDPNASVGVLTSGVVNVNGDRYVINNGRGYRASDGQPVEIVHSGSAITINSLGE